MIPEGRLIKKKKRLGCNLSEIPAEITRKLEIPWTNRAPLAAFLDVKEGPKSPTPILEP